MFFIWLCIAISKRRANLIHFGALLLSQMLSKMQYLNSNKKAIEILLILVINW